MTWKLAVFWGLLTIGSGLLAYGVLGPRVARSFAAASRLLREVREAETEATAPPLPPAAGWADAYHLSRADFQTWREITARLGELSITEGEQP